MSDFQKLCLGELLKRAKKKPAEKFPSMQSLLLSSSATIAYTNHASNANQMLRWKWAKINLAPLLLGKAAPSLPSRRNLYLDVEITCVFSADFLHMEEVLQNGRKPEKHTFSLLLKLSN